MPRGFPRSRLGKWACEARPRDRQILAPRSGIEVAGSGTNAG
jgi:hypothetical protein